VPSPQNTEEREERGRGGQFDDAALVAGALRFDGSIP
jgi:hypothetical protein